MGCSRDRREEVQDGVQAGKSDNEQGGERERGTWVVEVERRRIRCGGKAERKSTGREEREGGGRGGDLDGREREEPDAQRPTAGASASARRSPATTMRLSERERTHAAPSARRPTSSTASARSGCAPPRPSSRALPPRSGPRRRRPRPTSRHRHRAPGGGARASRGGRPGPAASRRACRARRRSRLARTTCRLRRARARCARGRSGWRRCCGWGENVRDRVGREGKEGTRTSSGRTR